MIFIFMVIQYVWKVSIALGSFNVTRARVGLAEPLKFIGCNAACCHCASKQFNLLCAPPRSQHF